MRGNVAHLQAVISRIGEYFPRILQAQFQHALTEACLLVMQQRAPIGALEGWGKPAAIGAHSIDRISPGDFRPAAD
jgi:hypothetical protein